MRVLVTAAHPDDETLGAGATIHKLSSQGHKVQLLTFTDGEGARGEFMYNRNDVLDDVSALLGIESYSYGQFPDNRLDTVPMIELTQFIEESVDGFPDIILTHHNGDLNVDHRKVYEATLTAFRPQGGIPHKIMSFYVPSSTEYNPTNTFQGQNVYVSLDENDVNAKHTTLTRCYKKEMRSVPHARSFYNMTALMSTWGAEVGTVWAEKFKLVREIL